MRVKTIPVHPTMQASPSPRAKRSQPCKASDTEHSPATQASDSGNRPGAVANAHDAMVVVARVGGAYGVRGWAHIRTFTVSPTNLLQYQPWFLGPEGDTCEWQQCSVEAARLHAEGLVAKFGAINDPESVQAIRGRELAVRRASLPALPDGEYYWVDLVGTPVFSLGGYRLGTVVEVIETGANAVLRVKGGSRVRVIPFADPILGTVLPRQRIEVDWDPEWS